MPHLRCICCNAQMEINVGDVSHYNRPSDASNPLKLIGSAVCRTCKTGTGFELNDNVIVFVEGKGSYGEVNANLPETAKTFLAEAEMSYRNGTPNAAVAMCRASIEAALTGFPGADLFTRINNAKPPLTDVEVGLAHATRLVTRDAIHRGELVPLSDVPSMLSATIRILNKLASSKTQ